VRKLRLRLAQGFPRPAPVGWSVHDTLFELVVESLDFFLGCLCPAVSMTSQLPLSLDDRKLVCAHHIHDFIGAAGGKGIRAQHGQALIGDNIVEPLFVFVEVFPVLLLQPGRIPVTLTPA